MFFFFRRRIFAYYLGFFFYLLETSAKVWLSSWTLNPLISVHCVSFNRRGRKKKGSSSSLSCYTLKFYFCEFLGSLFFSYFVLILLPIKKKFFCGCFHLWDVVCPLPLYELALIGRFRMDKFERKFHSERSNNSKESLFL